MHSILVIAQLIWTFLQLSVRGEATLTTALPWTDEDVNVKPTTLQKRIAVDNAGEQFSVSPDIFRKMGNVDFRRMYRVQEIWNWDYWCQLQAQRGNCTKKLKRYYYNSQLDQCYAFTFSGCFGNKNNFKSLTDCGRYCKGTALSPVKYIDRTISCSLQPNAGQCVALFDKFYYDVNARTCKMFVYGGCGGNPNRFASKQKCLLKCKNKPSVAVDK